MYNKTKSMRCVGGQNPYTFSHKTNELCEALWCTHSFQEEIATLQCENIGIKLLLDEERYGKKAASLFVYEKGDDCDFLDFGDYADYNIQKKLSKMKTWDEVESFMYAELMEYQKFQEEAAMPHIPPERIYRIGQYDMVLLEVDGDLCYMIAKNLYRDRVEFGVNNNYENSNADKICQQFAKEIEMIVGSSNLVEHTVDLKSSDSSRSYGVIKRKASLLTFDMICRYRELFLHDFNKDAWWLATPWSCTEIGVATCDRSCYPCNMPSGYYNIGVRPFCILKYSVLKHLENALSLIHI